VDSCQQVFESKLLCEKQAARLNLKLQQLNLIRKENVEDDLENKDRTLI
jgi:hypothetical protein